MMSCSKILHNQCNMFSTIIFRDLSQKFDSNKLKDKTVKLDLQEKGNESNFQIRNRSNLPLKF